MGNEQRGKKIAIIGALGYEQHGGGHSITCYSWPQLSKVRGLKDYDYVIVDLTIPEARKLIFNELRNALNLYVIDDLVCHDATIIVIGDPRFDVAGTPFLSAWTGLSFRWDHQSGTTVVLSSRLNKTEYISHLRSWQYSLIDVEIERQQLLGAKTKILSDLLASSATDLELEVEVIARNRNEVRASYSIAGGRVRSRPDSVDGAERLLRRAVESTRANLVSFLCRTSSRRD